MKAHAPLIIVFCLAALAGCSAIGLDSKRVDYKSDAGKARPLEVPPDLTMPAAGDRYTIPEGGGGGAVYSDFSKGSAVRPLAPTANVLPEMPNVKLERNGPQRWLTVDDRAENIWGAVREFWVENGFVIQSENTQAGLIQTDWQENRAKIPAGGGRSVFGKVFEKVYSSDEKDMYRMRLERSKDGSRTEITISHSGMAEVQNPDGNGYTWRSRGHEPEMEAAMLQLLMVKLGGGTTPAGPDPAAAPAIPVPPILKNLQDGSKRIVLGESFDHCWRNVGLALEKAGYGAGDLDRADGVYFVETRKKSAQGKSLLERLKFWRADEEESGSSTSGGKSVRYKVTVHENQGQCEIDALAMDGSHDAAALDVIESLYRQLTK